ncbi:hypothetical protein M413DRAFT_30737 [Hebeloma cylindrosporum]|uniref:Uncharacterized protein n=1 Tax=Hebeloma cylindrosporum TaxID=76867 RepID=A0A0C2Y908_HEBCY|nr:hypothetical protein M413DRAFT_30737 [Hebeloma cylindrosporum h7]
MNHSPSQGVGTGAVSAPIRPNDALPIDILQRIFDLVTQEPVLMPPPTKEPRRSLAQVCATWRDIVTTTPRYWTSYDFVQAYPPVQRAGSLLDLAEAFFLRSGDTIPLSVDFHGAWLRNVAHKLLEFVVRSYAHRLRFLSCVVTKRELRQFFGADYVRFPWLRKIDLTVRDEEGHIATRRPVKGAFTFSTFHRAPALRYVALRLLDGFHNSDLRLPWYQLTQIDLGSTVIRAGTFMRIMIQLFRLQEGIFCIDFTRPCSPRFPFPTITIAFLRRLCLKLIQPSCDGRIFRKLRMPSLQELSLEREEVGQPRRDMKLYKTLLSHLNAQLKHLTIAESFFPGKTEFLPRLHRIPQFTYQQLDAVLRLCPNLTSLYLFPGVFMCPFTLERLASGEFLPFLQKLVVSSTIGWDVIWMARERYLASTRSDSGSRTSARPVALNFLDLHVIGCGLEEANIRSLEAAVPALILPCGHFFGYVDVRDGDSPTS